MTMPEGLKKLRVERGILVNFYDRLLRSNNDPDNVLAVGYQKQIHELTEQIKNFKQG
jgi:hypothetical protein